MMRAVGPQLLPHKVYVTALYFTLRNTTHRSRVVSSRSCLNRNLASRLSLLADSINNCIEFFIDCSNNFILALTLRHTWGRFILLRKEFSRNLIDAVTFGGSQSGPHYGESELLPIDWELFVWFGVLMDLPTWFRLWMFILNGFGFVTRTWRGGLARKAKDDYLESHMIDVVVMDIIIVWPASLVVIRVVPSSSIYNLVIIRYGLYTRYISVIIKYYKAPWPQPRTCSQGSFS